MFISLSSFPKSCKLSSTSSLVNQIIGIKSSLRTEEVHLAAKKVIRLTDNLIKNGKLAESNELLQSTSGLLQFYFTDDL